MANWRALYVVASHPNLCMNLAVCNGMDFELAAGNASVCVSCCAAVILPKGHTASYLVHQVRTPSLSLTGSPPIIFTTLQIKPYEYTTVTHVDLRTISNFFKPNTPGDQDSTGHGGTDAQTALAAAAAPPASSPSHTAASSSTAANGTGASGVASTSAANGTGGTAHANGSPQVSALAANGGGAHGSDAAATLQAMQEPAVAKAAGQQYQPHLVTVEEVRPSVA